MNVYQQAIEKWGGSSQMEMLIEECSEVIQATQKLKRAFYSKDSNRIKDSEEHMCEELADLAIMLEQMYFIFDRDMIDKFKSEKLIRLENRINS